MTVQHIHPSGAAPEEEQQVLLQLYQSCLAALGQSGPRPAGRGKGPFKKPAPHPESRTK